MDTPEFTIDAKGKRLGRVATEAASLLLGKNRVDTERNQVAHVAVRVEHAAQLDISEKRTRETFESFSGYPGGRKIETLGHLASRRGYAEVLRRAVSGMIPKNKLHRKRMQNLIITE